MRVTVLISGSGTNLQALIDAQSAGDLPIEINHVISNVADAKGLQRAAKAGIATSVLPHGQYAERADFDRALSLLISSQRPELVVLAGFMRIIGSNVLDQHAGRMINLHPSLLPLYRGTDTYRKAIAAGDTEHGASIHFVTAELDGGPVLAQVRIPIMADDTPAALAARLGPQEHRLLTAAVEFLATHPVQCSDQGIMIAGKRLQKPLDLGASDRFEI